MIAYIWKSTATLFVVWTIINGFALALSPLHHVDNIETNTAYWLHIIAIHGVLWLFGTAGLIASAWRIGLENHRERSALQALSLSEERYRLLAENAPDIIYRITLKPEMQFEYVSPSVIEMTGYTPADHYADPSLGYKLVHPDDRHLLKSVADTNLKDPIVLRWVRKDGSVLWTEQHNHYIYNDAGEAVAIEGIARDITPRKLTEDALAENAKRHELIMKGTNAGTWEWNIQTGETIFNERWAQIIGYTLTELEPITIQTWADYTHPDDLARSNQLLKQHFSGELDNYECEVRVKHKDGHWVWVIDRGMVLEWTETGEPLRMFGTHMDITKRKQAEVALRQSEERYRIVVDTMAEGVVLHLADGTIQTSNLAAERILGLTTDQMIGRTSVDPRWRTIHEDGTPFPGETYPAMVTLRTGEPQSGVVMGVYKPNGDLSWISINSRPIFYNPSSNRQQPDAVVSTFDDITERKSAEKQAFNLALEHERRNLLTEFIEDTTHEFRTPLSTINTSVYMLNRLTDPAARKSKSDQITKQVWRITRLVDSLMMMAKLERSVFNMEHHVNLDQILEGMTQRWSDHCTKQHKLIYIPNPNLPLIVGDPHTLSDAIQQILDNACRFTPPKGTITISTRSDDQSLWVDIADTGIGISAESLPHIFETFWRKDTAHSTPGFGLGLAIAQRIIEQHDGKIEVESTVDVGSRFSVRLPIAK